VLVAPVQASAACFGLWSVSYHLIWSTFSPYDQHCSSNTIPTSSGFVGAGFVGARFVGARFVGARFVGARFVGARFVGARP